jgi:hypothetical protein
MTNSETSHGALFRIVIETCDETHELEYQTIEGAITDRGLAALLNSESVSAILWTGGLRLSGRPLTSAQELNEALVANAGVILRRLL